MSIPSGASAFLFLLWRFVFLVCFLFFVFSFLPFHLFDSMFRVLCCRVKPLYQRHVAAHCTNVAACGSDKKKKSCAWKTKGTKVNKNDYPFFSSRQRKAAACKLLSYQAGFSIHYDQRVQSESCAGNIRETCGKHAFCFGNELRNVYTLDELVHRMLNVQYSTTIEHILKFKPTVPAKLAIAN